MSTRQSTSPASARPSMPAPMTHAARGGLGHPDRDTRAGLIRGWPGLGSDPGDLEYASWLRLLRASAA